MNPPFPTDLQQKVEASGVIAVLVIDQVEHAAPVARALLDGGISVMELTLRTPAAIDAVRAIHDEVPEMLAGVGTVIHPDQVAAAARAGAAFAVAPGFNRRVMETAIEAGMPFAPGIATPTDIESALELGCRLLKFFPAEPSGGMSMIKAMAAPYNHLGIKYVPLGGLNVNNMVSYLESPLIAALGGSWLAPRDVIKGEQWSQITDNARAASDLVRQARSK
ncbi:MAG: keto-deoxy-phosphogluconate aldolase [Verrucomicrobia bacterium]|nr:MAG: keto-deoxy-phosphogluconate aldolase [Verrucomicrobiota bacterium]